MLKKVISLILLVLLFGLSSCSRSSMTDEEVMGTARTQILSMFPETTIYDKSLELPSLIYVDEYAVYVSWSSNDSDVIESTTGKVHHERFDKEVSLTAFYSYSDMEDTIKFNLTVSRDVFSDSINTNPTENKTSVSLKDIYYQDNELVIIIYFYNMIVGKEIHGISNFEFTIKDRNTGKTLYEIHDEEGYDPNATVWVSGMTSSRFQTPVPYQSYGLLTIGTDYTNKGTIIDDSMIFSEADFYITSSYTYWSSDIDS